jgi:hypothetical protein
MLCILSRSRQRNTGQAANRESETCRLTQLSCWLTSSITLFCVIHGSDHAGLPCWCAGCCGRAMRVVLSMCKLGCVAQPFRELHSSVVL